MTKFWVSLKASLHCKKSRPSHSHDSNLKTHLIRKSKTRTGCSSCTSFKNIKESVMNGGIIVTSRRFSSDKSPICSPRSIKSGDFMCELNSVCSSPKKSSTLVVSDSDYGVSCCGREKAGELEDAEFHHVPKHAVTELVEGDSSRKIVEMICRTSLMMKTEENYCDSTIMDKVLKVHNTNKTLARFEDYRESVKIRASNLPNKHPRCLADGNELLRFYATTLSCSLGTTSTTCLSEDCCACRIIRNGFSTKEDVKNGTGIGILTAATSGRALESVEDDGGEKKRKVLIVCRVIAGRVHRPIENVNRPVENVKDMVGLQDGFDSMAGKLGTCSNIEELYLLNPSSLLPCFVVICKP